MKGPGSGMVVKVLDSHMADHSTCLGPGSLKIMTGTCACMPKILRGEQSRNWGVDIITGLYVVSAFRYLWLLYKAHFYHSPVSSEHPVSTLIVTLTSRQELSVIICMQASLREFLQENCKGTNNLTHSEPPNKHEDSSDGVDNKLC